MSIKTLKIHLLQKSKEELIAEIMDLSAKFPTVKDYYRIKSGADSEREILEKYKLIITHEFFPARGYGKGRLSVAKKAISEFKKITQSKTELLDLMLHYVEIGVSYTLEFGDIDAPFYSSVEGMYEKVMGSLLTAKDLKPRFQTRCHQVVINTRSIGWGFHDTLQEMYDSAFDNEH